MAIRSFICDEVNDSFTADVYKDGMLRTGTQWTYQRIPSATASGNIASTSGKYLLHSVVLSETGSGIFMVGNVTAGGASAISVANSASALTFRGIGASGGGPTQFILDCVFDRGLVYRLTAVDMDGIYVLYAPTA